MTEWQRSLVTVTLGTDLHCGDRPLGFVARTRPYVPAHVPWYAAVAALARLLGRPDRTETYAELERRLDACLRFSPFFLVVEEDRLLVPWEEEARRAIQRGHLAARHGVGLSYATRGARANHLFETEVMLAVARDGRPARLRGLCFWKTGRDGFTADGRFEGAALETIVAASRWGGEQSKGFGVLREVTAEPVGKGTVLPAVFGATFSGDGPCPRIGIRTGAAAAYPLRYDAGGTAPVEKGRLRPLTGRRFTPNGPGQGADPGVVVWEPGWTAAAEQEIILHDRRFAVLACPSTGETG